MSESHVPQKDHCRHEDLTSRNPRMKAILDEVRKFAPTNATVIIQGESGTGKEVLACHIHKHSRRSEGPFVKVDCTAVPQELMESELFGYEEGAFTGARKGGKPGRIVAANGGTLFLDEIGDLPHALQAKLLRVLEDRRYDPVGSITSKQVDVRIIVATNRNLAQLVQQGQFRLDLFQRLKVFPVELPPLRERTEDIQDLTAALMKSIHEEEQLPAPALSLEVKAALLSYTWTGNIRELRNVLTRAMTLTEGSELRLEHLQSDVARREKFTHPLLADYMDVAEQNLLRWVLTDIPKKEEAAEKLGISRAALYKKMARYGMTGEFSTRPT